MDVCDDNAGDETYKSGRSPLLVFGSLDLEPDSPQPNLRALAAAEERGRRRDPADLGIPSVLLQQLGCADKIYPPPPPHHRRPRRAARAAPPPSLFTRSRRARAVALELVTSQLGLTLFQVPLFCSAGAGRHAGGFRASAFAARRALRLPLACFPLLFPLPLAAPPPRVPALVAWRSSIILLFFWRLISRLDARH